MKSNLIKLYVAILLSIVSIGVQGEIAEILNDMAKKDKSIDRIFKPAKKGFLGEGIFGVTYKGILLLNGKEVAMKFTLGCKSFADHEYKIYTYLNAINNPDVEAYGVPAVYYYGTWNEYSMLALTLLDNAFNDKFDHNKFTKIDLLIAFRDYVRITKYFHSRGVFNYKGFKLRHVMYRKHQGFLIDFNNAVIFNNTRDREDKLWAAKEDWMKFSREMRICTATHKDWLGFDSDDVWRMQFENFIPGLLEDAKTSAKFDGLRKVFIEFAKYAYGKDDILGIPFHDRMYQTINEELAKMERELKKPAVFSWLSTADKNAAILAKDSIPSISEIRNPFGSDEVEYQEVNFNFFNEFYHDKLNAEPEPEPERKSRKSGIKCWGK